MPQSISWLGRAVCAAVVCVSWVSAASADTFGAGANQFKIDFVTIAGDAGDLGSWELGLISKRPRKTYYTFTGVNRDAYRIGVYEITNDQWNKFQAELGVSVTGSPSQAYQNSSEFTGSNVPVNNVSWYEALQFANWLNTSTGHEAAYKFTGTQGTDDYTFDTWSEAEAAAGTNQYRHKDAMYYLPTEEEWIKAAYWNGTDIQSDATKPGDTLHKGDGSGTGWNYDQSGSNRVPWDVGSGSEELNGTFDMMGNAWELTESHFGATAFDQRATRGGTFEEDEDYLLSDSRFALNPLAEESAFGFRIASQVPEPASLSLLAIGGLALIKRRRS
jgi:formylglycine-generating enzyme required for sulfatase activity